MIIYIHTMASINITEFAGLGDSGWFAHQQKIFDLPLSFNDNKSSKCTIYDPNISPELGNRGIDIVKDGSIVSMMNPDRRYIVSTVQEPISAEGNYKYHENINVPSILHKKCLEHNIRPENILYVSGDVRVAHNHMPIKSIFVPGWNHLFWEEQIHNNIDISKRDCIHLFLNFNRIHKPHRMYFINRLEQLNLIDHNLVSCADRIDGETYSQHFCWIENDLREYGKLYDPHGLIDIQEQRILADRVHRKLPLSLDIHDFQSNGCFESDTFMSSLPFYQNSFMSVITESNAVGPGCYISEAVFRPIVFMHPFLVIAHSGTLQVLREWGFDVFDDIFDNRYDTEVDMFKRIEMVLEEILRINKYSKRELEKITRHISVRLMNNKNHYFSKKFKQTTKNYLNNMIDWINEDPNT